LLLRLMVVARVLHHLAVCRDKEDLETHVDAGFASAERERRVGTSAQEQQTYQPSASRETVTVLMVPCTGRDQRTAIRPILERTSEPFSSRAPLPYSL
jgi:hypothetical protein